MTGYRILFALQFATAAASGFRLQEGEEPICTMDDCAANYHKTMEYEGVEVGSNERYCEVFAAYRDCLNATAPACTGQINFHSTAYFTARQWSQHDCERVLAQAKAEGRMAQKCRLLPPVPTSSLRHCAMWGDPHIRTFDARVHACAEVGARPLIDNRYVLVQVSSGRVREDSMVAAVSKVTVIVREHNCTRQKRYEAATESEHLPAAFVDGTTHSTVDGKRAVEVLRHSPSHVEIVLHHAGARLQVRRAGPYLSVAVTIPSHVLAQEQLSYSSEHALPPAEQLCHAGCPLHSFVPLPAALANAQAFSDCHATPIHLPVKLAAERCKAINATDDFFDSCVFDLVTTGDDLLANMSRDAQSDLEMQLTQSRPYSVSRVDLSLYDHLANHFWTGCRPSSSPGYSIPPILIALIAALVLD